MTPLTSAAHARIVVILLACAVVAGCSSPVPTPKPLPATSTPTAAPDAPDPSTRPDQLFGGDCASIFTGTEIGALVGRELPEPVQSLVVPVIQSGGIVCDWGYPLEYTDVTPAGYLQIIALPASIADAEGEARLCEVYEVDSGPTGQCELRVREGGIVFSLRLNSGSGTPVADVEGDADGITQRLRELGSSAVPTTRAFSAEAWPATVDCVAIESSVRMGTIFDSSDMRVDTRKLEGYAYSLLPGLSTRRGWSQCGWESYESDRDGVVFVAATMYSDAAWAWNGLTDGGDALSVQGADAGAIVETMGYEGTESVLWVLSGSNVLAISGFRSAATEVIPAAAPLIEALNALR